MSQTDVSLVISGKYNADSAIRAAEDGLRRLLSAQNGVADSGKSLNDQLGDLSSVLNTVDRAYSTLSNTFTAASTKTGQTEQQIQSLTEKLAGLRQQSEAAGNYVREALSMGPVPENVSRSITSAQTAQQRLQTEVNRTTSDLEKQLSAFERQSSQLQRLASYMNAVESGQQNITQAVQETTAAINAQAEAEERAARVAERSTVMRPGQAGYQRQNVSQSTIDSARRDQAEAEAQAQREFYQQQEQTSQAAVQQAQREAEALQRLRDQINPLAAATRAFGQQKANLELMRERLSAEEYAAALKMLDTQFEQTTKRINGLQGLDTAGRPILFGLRPYQLQNLGYQVNDILTQLGSGTSLSQTLAQQGGQIIQIFDGVGRKIVQIINYAKEFPLIFTGAATAAGAIAYSLYQAYENAQKLADTQGFTAGSGASGSYSASWILAQEDAMRRLDTSAKDATASVQDLVTRGFSSSDISRITRIGAEMSRSMGVDVKTAVQDLGKAFRGTGDDMDSFIAKYGTMVNAIQRSQIQDALGRGDYSQAHTIFENAVQHSADQGNRAVNAPWYRRAYSWIRNANIDLEATEAGRMRLTDGVNAPNGEGNADADQRRLGGALDHRSMITAQRIQEDGQQQDLENRLRLGTLPRPQAEDYIRDRARARVEQEIQGNPLTVGGLDTPAAQERIRQQQQNDLAEQRQKWQQQDQAAARQRETQENASIRNFSSMVPLLEAGGRSNAANPASSARGAGQFLNSTWADVLRRHAPEIANGQSDSDLQALRSNDQVVTRAIQGFTQDIAQALRAAGLQVNERNLYAGYHFGATGGVRLLQHPDQPLQSTIGDSAIASNRAITHNADGSQRTGQQLLDELGRRTGQYTGADVGLYHSVMAFQQQQRDSDRTAGNLVQRAIAGSSRALGDAQAGEPQNGTARLDAEVRQRGNDAVSKLTQAIDQLNRNIEGRGGRPYQVQQSALDQIRSNAENAARLGQASERSNIQWMQPVTEGMNLQRSLLSQRQYAAETNNPQGVRQADQQITQITRGLIQAIDRAIQHYQGLSGHPAAMQAEGQTNNSIASNTAQLQQYRRTAASAAESTNEFANAAKGAFTDDAISGVRQFFSELRNGQGAIDSLRDSFEQFASSFLEQIAEMIMKAVLLKAIGSFSSGTSGGTGLLGSVEGLFNHTGGVVGSNGTSRRLDPMVFAGAQRFHTGGLPGLQPDEVPTILQRGEEVITRGDPRHVMNGGVGGQSSNVHVNVINAVDHGHAIQEGLKTPAGHKAIINFMSKNRSAVRSATGG